MWRHYCLSEKVELSVALVKRATGVGASSQNFSAALFGKH